MAKRDSQEFLGGGPRFNKVGAGVTPEGDTDPAVGDNGPIQVPVRMTSQGRQRLLTIVIIVILAGVLYLLANDVLGTRSTLPGQGGSGVSPTVPNVNPDKNLGP